MCGRKTTARENRLFDALSVFFTIVIYQTLAPFDFLSLVFSKKKNKRRQNESLKLQSAIYADRPSISVLTRIKQKKTD
jgi:hypothetical protein